MFGRDGQECCASVMKGGDIRHSTDNCRRRAAFCKGWPVDTRLELENGDASEDADDEFALQGLHKAIFLQARVKVLRLAGQNYGRSSIDGLDVVPLRDLDRDRVLESSCQFVFQAGNRSLGSYTSDVMSRFHDSLFTLQCWWLVAVEQLL